MIGFPSIHSERKYWYWFDGSSVLFLIRNANFALMRNQIFDISVESNLIRRFLKIYWYSDLIFWPMNICSHQWTYVCSLGGSDLLFFNDSICPYEKTWRSKFWWRWMSTTTSFYKQHLKSLKTFFSLGSAEIENYLIRISDVQVNIFLSLFLDLIN